MIVESEYFMKTLFCFCVAQFGINDFKEIIVIYAFAFLLQILDHCKNWLISFVKAELLKYFLNLYRVNDSSSFLIEEIESWLELLKIMLRQLLFGWDGNGRMFVGSFSPHRHFKFELFVNCYNCSAIALNIIILHGPFFTSSRISQRPLCLLGASLSPLELALGKLHLIETIFSPAGLYLRLLLHCLSKCSFVSQLELSRRGGWTMCLSSLLSCLQWKDSALPLFLPDTGYSRPLQIGLTCMQLLTLLAKILWFLHPGTTFLDCWGHLHAIFRFLHIRI